MPSKLQKPKPVIASNAATVAPVSERKRRVADVDIDQTITASAAQARFSMDAQRRKIASRIIIEAVSSGAIEMMCKTIVTEVHARPIKPKPPTKYDKLIKNIERCDGGLFIIDDNIPPKIFTPTINTECIQASWIHSIIAVVDPRIHGTRPRSDGRTFVIPGDRAVYYDVRFREDQIKNLIFDYKAGKLTYSPLPSASNASNSYDYKKLIPDLIASAQNGTLEKEFGSFSKHGTKAKLEKAVLDAIDGLSEPTARRQATRLIVSNEQAKIEAAKQE